MEAVENVCHSEDNGLIHTWPCVSLYALRTLRHKRRGAARHRARRRSNHTRWISWECSHWMRFIASRRVALRCGIRCQRTLQEGQHPLTGQRAANFRLLANQW